MKYILCLAICTFVASLCVQSDAFPFQKRMVYAPQLRQWHARPQRLMYVHYVHPSLTHSRSTQAAAALVSGDSVATGTFLKDCNHEEAEFTASSPAAAESALNEDNLAAAVGAHVASSVAEAYPEPAEADTAVSNNDNSAKVPREYQFEETPSPSDLLVPAPLAPQVPNKANVPADEKKKIYVELDETPNAEEAQGTEEHNAVGSPVGAESDDDENDLEQYPVQYPNRRPVSTRKPTKASTPAKPLPTGTFFPVNFGGTSGGAIAIANSFSTGEGGSATSHAVAYGSPEAVRARGQVVRRH